MCVVLSLTRGEGKGADVLWLCRPRRSRRLIVRSMEASPSSTSLT